MADLEHNIEVNLRGDLSRRARSNERDIKRFAKNSSTNLKRLQQQARTTGRGLSTLGKGLLAGAGLGGAFGVAQISKDVIEAQERFERLGIAVDRPREEMVALKKQIFDIAQAPDINIAPKALFDAISEIVEKTGDLEFAKDNMRNLALAIQAANAEGASVGALTAQFKKLGITSEQDVKKALDILINQGKAGAFTLKNLAELGERNVAAYASMGRTGLPAIREMGAALQLIRQATGSSEQATTAFESLLATFADNDKLKVLQERGGIQVFDPEALKEGREVLRPINELIVDIIRASGGKKTLLSEVFGEQAIRALNAAATEFQQTGAVDSLQNFYDVNGDGATLMKDAARGADIMSQQLKSLGDKISQTAQNMVDDDGMVSALKVVNQELSEVEKRSRKAGTSLNALVGLPGFDNEIDSAIDAINTSTGIPNPLLESSAFLTRNSAGVAKLVIELLSPTGREARIKTVDLPDGVRGEVRTGPNPVGSD